MGLRGVNAKPVKRQNARKRSRKQAGEPWNAPGLTRPGRVRAFIENLWITSGVHAGQRFKVRDWQWEQIIKPLYETGPDGRRLKRQALITMPRKQGKTALAAALALCHLVGPEAEPRGQVISAASARDQATLLMRECVAFIRGDRKLAERIIIREHNRTLEDTITGSTFQVLPADAKRAHGLSVSCAIMDEVGQWQKRDLYDALVTGGAARKEPLFVTISTQSHDKASLMSELVTYGRRVLDGVVEDPTFLPVIFAAPDDADPWSEETWHACNPALGDFRSLEEMRVAADQAKALPSREPSFRLLYLNQPVDASAHFLNRRDWDACAVKLDDDGLFGKAGMLAKQRCILGLDLSSTTDLSAVAAFFPGTGDLRVWFWMPADNLEEAARRDHVPYALWVKQGLIEATPGRAIDKRFIAHKLGELVRDYDVQFCAADRWRLDEIERLLAEDGIKLKLEPHGQGWKDMGGSVSAFETMVLRGEIKHTGHAVLDYNVACAVTVSDPTGARKLVKDKLNGRIDGLVAAVMAVGAAVKVAPKRESVYKTRGVVSLRVV
jgi:phage terminase large subunit-like protein